MARSNLSIVQRAIEIQGYITVRVAGQDLKAGKVSLDPNGEWITDIPTADLCGYVRIKKTKPAVVAQAKAILAKADEIMAARRMEQQRAAEWGHHS